MLRCTACIRRTLTLVFDDASALQHQSTLTARPFRAGPHIHQSWRRSQYQSYATATSTAPQSQEYSENVYAPPRAKHITDPRRMEGKSFTPPWRTPNGPNVAKTTEMDIPPTEVAVRHEVRWLRDPLKLADRVAELLGQGSYFMALAIARESSKDLQCTVSWNHLVDYNMARGKVKEAIKTYNEMKKRAQVPDGRTYTTLFRGFGWALQTQKPQAHKVSTILADALKIYHAMFFEKSPVKPTIIHTNAVLKVCAFAGDMDALYGVASKLPEKGNGAPDTLTYYTILNAIRSSVEDSTRASHPKSRVQAVSQGMRLWQDIKARWSTGDLLLSENLVCAMGRLLMIGGETGADEVLSLIEQTMGVPRQVPKLGDPARHGVKKQEERPLDEFLGDNSRSSTMGALSQKVTPPLDNDALGKSLFASVPTLSKSSLVHPSRNTLSLAIEACTAMSLPRPAQDYWGLLTSPHPSGRTLSYNVLPDSANYHSYLRLLRLQRASSLAISLVSEMHSGTLPVYPPPSRKPAPSLLQPKTFRIALSTCLRDKLNPNALRNATALLNIMIASLEDADALSLTMFLTLATSSPHAHDDAMVLLSAEQAALPVWRNLRSLRAYSSDPASPSSPGVPDVKYPSQEAAADDGWARQNAQRKRSWEQDAAKAPILEAGEMMVRLYSRILDVGRERLEKEVLKRVGGERARVEAFLKREKGIEIRVEGGWMGKAVGWREKTNKRLAGKNEREMARSQYSHAGNRKRNGEMGAEEGLVRKVGSRTMMEVEELRKEEGGWKDPGERTLREHRGPFSFRPQRMDEGVGDGGGAWRTAGRGMGG